MSSVVISGDTSGAITLSAPAIAGTNTLSLPAVTDTLVGLAATQTLTNKSIAATQLTGTIAAARLPTGSVLQVVQTVKTDTFSTSSSTLADITGLSVTITPSSASNKILVIVDLHISYSVYAGIVHLLRGATKIYAGDGGLNRCGLYSNVYYGVSGNTLLPVTATFLDSPATTSSTTYKLQTANYSAGIQYVNRTGDDNNDPNRDGLTASSITVMEIAA
jgi:hypothetical protein